MWVFLTPQFFILFDISRKDNPHLAFGFGEHNCFGRHLALAEARLAILALLDSIPNFELFEFSPKWKKNSLFRGMDSLIFKLT